MAMETVVAFARASARVVVLPPPQPMYLLNREGKATASARPSHSFADFFPLRALNATGELAVATMAQFWRREVADARGLLHGAYADARGADLEHWSFLTGPPERVAGVVEAYGVGSLRQADGTIDHVVATFIIDAEGRIAERFVGLDDDREELLRALERLASG